VYATPTAFNIPHGGPLTAYAKGGILGEAGPEAILPLKRNAQGELGVSGAGGGVEVNVYNRADVEVTTKESQGADGQQVIDMYIDKRVNQRFSDGSLDKMLRTNYGIMRNAGA
jgi:phage-related minor tail protein